MIAILCPTRDRWKNFQRMKDSVSATSNPENVSIYSGTNGIVGGQVDMIFPEDCPTVFMWNKLAKMAMQDDRNKLFTLGSDDIIFATPEWDKALIDHYNSLENKIHAYHLQDSRDPLGTPHIIVTREYVDAMGYFLLPIFLHWFGDTWTRDIAKENNVFTHLTDYLLIHDKPSDNGQSDETHNRIRSMGWHERDKVVNDSCQHFLEFEKNRLARHFQ